VLVQPSGIDLSGSTLRFLARHLRQRRREIGSWWRRLPAGRQALLALAHLRCGDTYGRLAAAALHSHQRRLEKAHFRLAAGCPVVDAAAPLELDRSSKASATDHTGRWRMPSSGGVELFNLGRVPTERYRYRGNKIPNPWTLANHG